MSYDYGNWVLVLVNVFIFYVFIKESFKPTTKVDWQSFRMIMAFIVALFAEMYGFPLTIYLLTSYFGNRLNLDFSHNNGHLLTTLLNIPGDPHFNFIHMLSIGFIIFSVVLLGKSWKILYAAQKNHQLATTGPYKFIRHPQYIAFILLIIGFLLQWPTIITILMAPFMIIRYVVLAHVEDKRMMDEHPRLFQRYRQLTPGFFPSVASIVKVIRSQ